MIVRLCDNCGTSIEGEDYISIGLPGHPDLMELDTTECVMSVLDLHFGPIEEPGVHVPGRMTLVSDEDQPLFEITDQGLHLTGPTLTAEERVANEKRNREEAIKVTAQLTGVKRRGMDE